MPTATELLAEIIRKETTAPTLARKIVSASLVDQTAGQALKEAQQTREAIENADLFVDDGIPPAPPQNVTAIGGMRSLFVQWDDPPASDYVESAVIRLTDPNGAASTQKSGVYGTSFTDLAPGQWQVAVAFVDHWRRRSAFSAPVSVTVNQSVADQISAEAQVAASQINGVLAASNLPQIPQDKLSSITDPAKLVNAVMAVLQNATAASPGYEGFQNIVGANLLAAWTVAAGRAIIANGTINRALIADAAIGSAQIDTAVINTAHIADAAITNAKVNDISASKITAGNISASLNITAGGNISTQGGTISAGGAALTNSGVEMANISSYNDPPTSNRSSKITPDSNLPAPNPWSAIHFYSSNDAQVRGLSLWSSGVSGGAKEGRISLIADTGGQNPNANSTASLLLTSNNGGYGKVAISAGVNVNGDTLGVVTNSINFNTDSFVISRRTKLSVWGTTVTGLGANMGSFVSVPHGMPSAPLITIVQMRPNNSSSWYGCAIGTSTVKGVIWRVDDSNLYLKNQDDTGCDVRAFFMLADIS